MRLPGVEKREKMWNDIREWKQRHVRVNEIKHRFRYSTVGGRKELLDRWGIVALWFTTLQKIAFWIGVKPSI